MNFLSNLFTPSVELASRGLTKAIATFEKAKAAHNQRANAFFSAQQAAEIAAIAAGSRGDEEILAAQRADRIAAKLSDLLA